MFSRQNPSSRASLSNDWILVRPSKILAFSLTSIDRINSQIFLSAFSAERCVFLSNKRMNRELNLPFLLTIHGTRTLERGRLVSIRWLENLDHMALARGKTKNEAAVCDGYFEWPSILLRRFVFRMVSQRGERETRVTGAIFIGIPSGSLCGGERVGGRLDHLRGHPDHVLIFFRHI